MPENWMDWARLIGTFIGATGIAILAGWQLYARLIRPAIKRVEPIFAEITGPGNEPGIRQMIELVGAQARNSAVAANNAADGVNLLRRDVQSIHHDHVELKKDVRVLTKSADKQGERIGRVESGLAAVVARVDRVEGIQDARGCALNLHGHQVVEGDQQLGSAGRPELGKLAPPTPGGNVSADERDSKEKAK